MGVKAAKMHRAGLRAEILNGGTIHIGDAVAALDDPLEQNKILIRRFFDEMWNPWNFEKVDELLAPDIKFRGTLGAELKGRDAFRAYMCKVQAAFPDFHNTILELTAEHDHHGEIFGMAPTGKSIAYSGAAFFRIADGKVIEGWVLGDLLALLRALGARSIP
jgi:predicted ester cyclase